MRPRVGETYLHRRMLDPASLPNRVPLRVRITKVSRGTVYYRPDYGLHDDGTPWLGAPSCCPLEDVGRWLEASC